MVSDWPLTWAISARGSFSARSSASFSSDPQDERCLTFVAGGRPVREKGFVELCRQFAAVRTWAEGQGIAASLAILCREPRQSKGAAYIAEIEAAIEAFGLQAHVRVEPKTSVERMRQRIASSSALIVPSLHDPFCLMPSYAMDVERPSFISAHSGVSENLRSREFVFDPLADGDLLRAVQHWYATRPPFVYHSRFPRFDTLYLKEEAQ